MLKRFKRNYNRKEMIFKNGLCLLGLICVLGSCSSSTERSQLHAEVEEGQNIPKIDTIEIIQMQFRPAVLNVRKGDTVIFVNNDIVAHDATEIANRSWTSGA